MFDNIDAALKGNINNPTHYSQYARDLYQTEIDTHFQYANNYYEIEMESSNGSNNFIPLGVRIDRATSMTTGMKLSDDYKKLIFQSNLGVILGRKFSFSNNTWLTTDNSTLLTNSSSCVVRRCNNVIRYLDGENYDSEPCVIDYNASSNNLEIRTDIILPSKNIKVYTQYNDITKQIEINQRFIFGSQVFKVIGFEDYNRLITEEKTSVGLMTIIMELDAKSEEDDFVNDIAVSGLVLNHTAQAMAAVAEIQQEAVNQEEDLVISPEDFEIREGKTKEYILTYRDVNVTNQTEYEILSTDISQLNYKIVRNENGISISCIHKVFNNALMVKFTYEGLEKIVKIYLRGLF